MRITIALGGNAIISAKQKGTYQEQAENIDKTMAQIAELHQNHQIIIAHGNGPQVGNLLIQHEAGKKQVPALPMFMCGAQTQGQIGYLIQQSLTNQNIKAATIVTQVLVNKEDASFKKPSKPVGPFYKEPVKGETMIEDAGRGYRKIVASPLPQEIIEIETIKKLIDQNILTIACGGGGIPVIKEDDKLKGVDAVIDKDRAGQLLANETNSDIFVILTDIEQVCLNFNTPDQECLGEINLTQLEKYISENHFSPGSMLPKIEAAINFIKAGGQKVIITHPFKLLEALQNQTGTHIIK